MRGISITYLSEDDDIVEVQERIRSIILYEPSPRALDLIAQNWALHDKLAAASARKDPMRWPFRALGTFCMHWACLGMHKEVIEWVMNLPESFSCNRTTRISCAIHTITQERNNLAEREGTIQWLIEKYGDSASLWTEDTLCFLATCSLYKIHTCLFFSPLYDSLRINKCGFAFGNHHILRLAALYKPTHPTTLWFASRQKRFRRRLQGRIKWRQLLDQVFDSSSNIPRDLYQIIYEYQFS